MADLHNLRGHLQTLKPDEPDDLLVPVGIQAAHNLEPAKIIASRASYDT